MLPIKRKYSTSSIEISDELDGIWKSNGNSFRKIWFKLIGLTRTYYFLNEALKRKHRIICIYKTDSNILIDMSSMLPTLSPEK